MISILQYRTGNILFYFYNEKKITIRQYIYIYIKIIFFARSIFTFLESLLYFKLLSDERSLRKKGKFGQGNFVVRYSIFYFYLRNSESHYGEMFYLRRGESQRSSVLEIFSVSSWPAGNVM